MKKKILIFHGKDKNQFKIYCQQIIKKNFFNLKHNFDLHEFNGIDLRQEEQEQLNELLLVISNNSLFNQDRKKIIILWDYDLISSNKVIEKLILSCSKENYFFLYSKNLARNIQGIKNKFNDKLFFVEEKYLNKKSIQDNLINYFGKNISIEKEAISYLVDYFFQSIDLFDKELEKISLYIYPSKKITYKVVRKLLTTHANPKIFKLIDSFFTRDKKEIFNDLLIYITYDSGFQQFITLMIRELYLIYSFKELKREKKSNEYIFSSQKIYYNFQKQKIINRSLAFNRSELIKLINLFIELERVSKSKKFSNLYRYKNIDYSTLHFFCRLVLNAL